MRYLKHFIFKRRREKKLRKKGFSEETKIGIFSKGYRLKNTLAKEDFINKEIETLSDVFSEQVFHIEKKKKSFKDDEYLVYVQDFPKLENYEFRAIKEGHRLEGISYKGDELLVDFQESSSALFIGRSGSGKTTSIITVMEYHTQAIQKFHPDTQIIKIIIDPKADSFNSILNEQDYFFRLDSDEEWEAFIEILEKIDKESKEASHDGVQTENKYIIILDELLMVFNKAKERDKYRQELKDKAVIIIERIIIAHARQQLILLLAATQSFSVQDSAISLNYFSSKLVSKAPNSSFALSMGSRQILRKDLKFGRWCIISTETISQFPASLSKKYLKKKKTKKTQVQRNYSKRRSSKLIGWFRKEFKETQEIYSEAKKKELMRRYKAYVQKRYAHYDIYFSGSASDYQKIKDHKYKDDYQNRLMERHHYVVMRAIRKEFIESLWF